MAEEEDLAAAYAARSEINWERLDKTKFFTMGMGIFTSVTVALYPFSVIKTRMQVSSLVPSSSSPTAALRQVTAGEMVRQIARSEGVAGFYRGFGTVILGMMPMRFIYMAVLEVTKAGVIRGLKLARDAPPAHADRLPASAPTASNTPASPAAITSPTRAPPLLLQAAVDAAAGEAAGAGAGDWRQAAGPLPAPPSPARLQLSDAAIASIASGVGGMCASLASQLAIVPVDVVASRLIAQEDATGMGGHTRGAATAHSAEPAARLAPSSASPSMPSSASAPHAHMGQATAGTRINTGGPAAQPSASAQHSPGVAKYRGGIDAFRTILRTEGLAGLYRGFGLSLLTYVPSGFVWWATYSASQRAIWRLYFSRFQHAPAHLPSISLREEASSHSPPSPLPTPSPSPSPGLVVAVQAASGVCAGLTAAAITTPLDTLKTRVQVERRSGASAGVGPVLRQLLRQQGVAGLYRGLGPRSASMALWGTTMVTSYEFLKRMCVREEEEL